MKNLNFFKIFAIAGCVFLSTSSNAQLVDCNVFLQGQHVEVGINWNGAYGSSTAAPAGYYRSGASPIPNSATCGYTVPAVDQGVGFVVDPAMDGWTTGTPPFYGDYFMPDVPQEGWSLLVNGKQVNAWNANDIDSPMEYSVYTYPDLIIDSSIVFTTYVYDSVTHVWDTLHSYGYDTVIINDTVYYIHGANIGYDTVGSTLVGTWQGMFDSVAITQITTLDMDSLYFTVKVILTNLSITPKENVYYLRTVDPDNDEQQSGVFATRNTIDYQLPNPAGLTVVSARGTVYPDAYLALGTGDFRAKSIIIKFILTPDFGKLDGMFAGDTTHYIYNQGDSLTADVGIGLLFHIGHLAAVDTVGAIDSALRVSSTAIPPNRAIINYAYNFNGANIGAGIEHNDNVINNNRFCVYPNPAKNNINIIGLNNTESVSIYNMMGEKVLNFKASGNNLNSFNIATLPSGQYVLQVMGNDGNVNSRILIQKL